MGGWRSLGRVVFPVLLTLLTISLFMTIYSYQVPIDVSREVPLYMYTARGFVDYNVTLKPNMLYEDRFLVNPSKTFLRLVEKVTLNIVYSLDFQPEASNVTSILEVDLVLNHPQVWSRKISSTRLQSDSNVIKYTVELDIESALQLASNISREVDIPASRYTIDVNCYGKAKFVIAGQLVSVSHPFSLQITVDLFGKVVEFSRKNIVETRSQKSNVTEEVVVSLGFTNMTVRTFRSLSITLLSFTSALTALYTGLLVHRKFRESRRDAIVYELKKYRSIIVEAREILDLPQTITVKVGDLGELVKISEELLKPIIHVREQGKHVFYVLDGSVKYTYERAVPTENE